jgi:hypothetical protein
VHKAAAEAIITTNMAPAMQLARPYQNKEERKDLPSMPGLLTKKLKA